MKLKYTFDAKVEKNPNDRKILGNGLFKQISKNHPCEKNKQTNRQNKTLSDKMQSGVFINYALGKREKGEKPVSRHSRTFLPIPLKKKPEKRGDIVESLFPLYSFTNNIINNYIILTF